VQQGGDKLTLNLNGGSSSPAASSHLATSPTTPKVCNLPSMIPLVPTPVEKNTNKNESVTVTHFSDIHGGVVEKISVPVTSGSNVENGNKSPKLETTKTSTTISNNPFADDMMTTTIITTSTVTSPTIKVSTNPFRSSFNSNEKIDPNDKSMKISFPILAKNPFHGDDVENGNGVDAVDNEKNLSSISSINLKIDNNDNNVTTIKMDEPQINGFKEPVKKVKVVLHHVVFDPLTFVESLCF
jgi:hypothetical protein